MFYRFQLELLTEIQFVCMVTALPAQRILPEKKDVFEIHLCEINPKTSEYEITIHFPGQPVPYQNSSRPIKKICISAAVKPNCFEAFPFETRKAEIKLMKKEFFMIPLITKVSPEFVPRIKLLFSNVLNLFKEEKQDLESLVKIIRLTNYLSWDHMISGGFPSSYVTAACNYIRNNYTKKVTIGTIADEIGITPNYLSRLFQEKMGRTVKEVLDIARSSGAREGLFHSDESMPKIAKRYGFSNEKSMNLIFQRLFQMNAEQCKKYDQKKGMIPWESEAGMLQLLFQK